MNFAEASAITTEFQHGTKSGLNFEIETIHNDLLERINLARGKVKLNESLLRDNDEYIEASEAINNLDAEVDALYSSKNKMLN